MATKTKNYIEAVKKLFPTEQDIINMDRRDFSDYKYQLIINNSDIKWIDRYILNRVYSEWDDNIMIYGIHEFLSSEDYKHIISDFQNLIVDIELKKMISCYSKEIFKIQKIENIYGCIETSVLSTLTKHYNMNKITALNLIENRKDNVLEYLQNLNNEYLNNLEKGEVEPIIELSI